MTLNRSLRLIKDQEKSEREFYREHSNIPQEYLDYKWISNSPNDKFYDPKFISHDFMDLDSTIIESRTNARNEAHKYALSIRENYKNGKSLLIIGGQRSGKTVLATLILREAINKLVGSVYFVPFIQLIVEANVYLKADIEEYTAQYIDPDILCIDDIDSQRDTSNRFKEYFDYILTSRKLASKPTIITSRLSLSKIRFMVGDGVYCLLSDKSIYKNINILTNEFEFGDVNILDLNLKFDSEKLSEKIDKYNRGKKTIISSKDVHNILKECICK